METSLVVVLVVVVASVVGGGAVVVVVDRSTVMPRTTGSRDLRCGSRRWRLATTPTAATPAASGHGHRDSARFAEPHRAGSSIVAPETRGATTVASMPPPGVSSRLTVARLLAQSRSTIARPRPVPPGRMPQ